jgi:WD40 repeat protein
LSPGDGRRTLEVMNRPERIKGHFTRAKLVLALIAAVGLVSCAGAAGAALLSPPVLMFLDKPILRAPHAHWVTAVAFSPDGATVATGAGDGYVRLWDSRSGILQSMESDDAMRGVSAVAFSPDGRTIAVVGGIIGGDLLLWDVASGKIVGKASSPDPAASAADPWVYKGRRVTIGTLSSVAFSPDGMTLATGGDGAQLRDARSGAILSVLGTKNVRVSAVVFSRDGATLATAGADGKVRLWSVPAGELVGTREGPNRALNDVAFSPDGRRIVAVSAGRGPILGLGRPGGGELWIWDGPAVPARRVAIEKGIAQRVAFIEPARVVVAAGTDLVSVEVGNNPRAPRTLWSHSQDVLTLAVSPEGGTVASGGKDRTADLWDWRAGRLVERLPGLVDVVSAMAASSDGETFASAGLDLRFSNRLGSSASFEERRDAYFSGESNAGRMQPSDVRIWSATDGRLMSLFPIPSSQVTAITFLPDSPLLVVAGWLPGKGGMLSLWDSHDGRLVRDYPAEHTEVLSVAVAPSGRVLAGGDGEGTLSLWNVQTAQKHWTRRFSPGIKAVAFSPAGTSLAVADGTGAVRLVDPETGKILRMLPGHSAVESLVFSPDARILAAGRREAGIEVWNLDSDAPPRNLRAPGDYFGTMPGFIAFSLDGRLIACGGHGKDVALFDARSLSLVRELRGHAHAPTAAVFLPDGRLVTAGEERSLILWDPDQGSRLATWVYVPADPARGWNDEWIAFTPGGDYTGSASLARLGGLILGGEVVGPAKGAMRPVDRLFQR